MNDLRLKIVDLDPQFVSYATESFAVYPNVEIVNSTFEEAVPFDCLICPGNPHGYNVSGMDRAIGMYFGQWIHDAIADEIMRRFGGDMPAGTAILINTEHEMIPLIVYTPTFPKRDESALYGMRAALDLIVEYTSNTGGIAEIACPGLGTYLGMLSEDVQSCASQMALAYGEVLQ